MTETYLLSMRTAAVLFPVLALLTFVPTAIALYRRHGIMTRWRVLSLYGGAYYALSAFCMTVVPLPSRAVDVCAKYPTFAEPQLTPGVAVADVWKEAGHRVTLDALVLHNSAVWQTAFNLVLLLPLGVFVRFYFRRSLPAAVAAGAACSLFFELTQYTGLWGLYTCPYRLFAVDDLLVNTAGAALGWAAAGPLARALPDLETLDDRALVPGKVPFGRRLIALLLDMTGVALLTAVLAVMAPFVLGTEGVVWAPPAAFAFWYVLVPWRTGATPGKHALLLRLVTTADGGRPRLAGLTLRAAVLGLPQLVIWFAAVLFLTFFPEGAAGAVEVAVEGDTGQAVEGASRIGYEGLTYTLADDPVGGLLLLLALAAGPALVAAYAWAVHRHSQGLALHDILSGVRNVALPHTRARGGTPTPRGPGTPRGPEAARRPETARRPEAAHGPETAAPERPRTDPGPHAAAGSVRTEVRRTW
ncbi:teicoplanin resistance protein VanZ [Streptomyces armeniacus]|uniref:Teicoplanin resistance protein VanZ n=1 Tax=Streptomyces armeniacus TaxID=83291 RepID=A0A345XYK7_9ACTN|nr:VanZ family protein [Streptomyces armeniacus]AXK36723.1 teicoplanin resistance protein VanZ [Streptomyces armeniacus]